MIVHSIFQTATSLYHFCYHGSKKIRIVLKHVFIKKKLELSGFNKTSSASIPVPCLPQPTFTSTYIVFWGSCFEMSNYTRIWNKSENYVKKTFKTFLPVRQHKWAFPPNIEHYLLWTFSQNLKKPQKNRNTVYFLHTHVTNKSGSYLPVHLT